VLKCHDEEDLKLSVERGLWATQSHNEPVLDQAFRSSRDAVILFFSANKSGEWYGYGRMTGPITHSEERTHSWMNRSSGTTADSSTSSSRPPIILEGEEGDATERPPLIFTESEARLADHSPQPLTPSSARQAGGGEERRGESAPASMNPGREALLSAGGHAVAANLRLPKGEGHRGGSLDPKALAAVRNIGAASSLEKQHQVVLNQQLAGRGNKAAELSAEDGVWRKDTLVTPEERNARLENMEEVQIPSVTDDAKAGWGRPFEVEWIKVGRLPFSKTKNIRNSFNANREVKISRDGTEIEPTAGEQLIAEFWKDEGGVPAALQPNPLISPVSSMTSKLVASGLVSH